MIYDYIIKIPLDPISTPNILNLFSLIELDGGSPLLVTNRDISDNVVGFLNDGETGNGHHLIHFRLNRRMTAVQLEAYIQSEMIPPFPIIPIIMIRSLNRQGASHDEVVSMRIEDVTEFFDILTLVNGKTVSRRATIKDKLDISKDTGSPDLSVISKSETIIESVGISERLRHRGV